MKWRVGIIGYRGYSGAELVRLLGRHSQVEPVLVEHRDTGEGTSPIRGQKPLTRLPADPQVLQSEGLSLMFLATPPEVSMELAPAMLERGMRVVDLSGAFRLRTPENYLAW